MDRVYADQINGISSWIKVLDQRIGSCISRIWLDPRTGSCIRLFRKLYLECAKTWQFSWEGNIVPPLLITCSLYSSHVDVLFTCIVHKHGLTLSNLINFLLSNWYRLKQIYGHPFLYEFEDKKMILFRLFPSSILPIWVFTSLLKL